MTSVYRSFIDLQTVVLLQAAVGYVLWASTGALPLRGAPLACKQLEVCLDEGKITLPCGCWCDRAVRLHLSGVSSRSDHHRAQKPLVDWGKNNPLLAVGGKNKTPGSSLWTLAGSSFSPASFSPTSFSPTSFSVFSVFDIAQGASARTLLDSARLV